MSNQGRVLIVAGSDSGGGAGIQADLKTVTMLGGYAMTAITAVTVQNTLGVTGVHKVPPDIVAAQIQATLSDIGADVVKTGMLVDREIIIATADALSGFNIPRVVDPVMVAKGGHPLLADDAAAALVERLARGAAVLTPNLPEAEVLTGRKIVTESDMFAAVPALRALGAKAVLLKGGHLAGDRVVDILIMTSEVVRFDDARIVTKATHGTGCTLASAIAAGMSHGLGIEQAVRRARVFVRHAIETAIPLGQGHGPLNHGAR
ncbi:MAG: bifunctional hydroxymethylpyrimidine kinase/phosphomethylpyrimidine kinase [Rhodospirillaceae bacterium]